MRLKLLDRCGSCRDQYRLDIPPGEYIALACYAAQLDVLKTILSTFKLSKGLLFI